MAVAISLYLDENLAPVIANQLRRRGIDAVSVRDLQLLGDIDINHLHRATEMQRDLVTSDADFLNLAAEGIGHCGIVYARQRKLSVGDWVESLELFCHAYTMDDMINRVEYL